MSRSRTADATIRGFNYQFDASIRLILAADDNSMITVEDIEDVDVSDGKSINAIQCKYYEGTKLTNSVLREIVKPMLEDHQRRVSKINYYIYGYFKDKVDLPLQDSIKFKDEVLTYTKDKIAKNIANDLGLSLKEIESFLSCLKFEYTKKYGPHKEAAIDDLKQAKKCSIDEAKSHYYPNAFTLISDLATKSSKAERTIRKADFLSRIDSKQILFHHWLLREKEESIYCRMIRQSFFTQNNVSPYARFFSIECSGTELIHELKDLLVHLGNKWSSSRRVRLEPRQRYAPYVLLRNCPASKLSDLKAELYHEAYSFVDGFPFNGASFTVEHIHSDQTNENRILVRILANESELETALASMTNRTKQLYEFFNASQLPIEVNFRHVRIPITSISMVSNII
ncbi:hypothetical protein IEN85_19290 [Pelagicoccus sp. NFK12]|uniref:DUF4297 domain-containing protein n=1 Tax=Pelagicoccus enzymogenes TaxID=2773457 RepID=A0A927FC35_9BACT|nr:DUF4297 family anti-phage-associated protein [Pelagicoccus enzymogenes]MBD5781654.1 hypothetical protein [Pelagicoccus enzymogenes]